jgi:hypothetical protein
VGIKSWGSEAIAEKYRDFIFDRDYCVSIDSTVSPLSYLHIQSSGRIQKLCLLYGGACEFTCQPSINADTYRALVIEQFKYLDQFWLTEFPPSS